MAVELGTKQRDKITGFVGVVTGRAEYLTGCNQCLLVPPVKDGAYVDSQWFDEQRLEAVDRSRVTLNNGSTPGAYRLAPKQQ